MKNKRIGNKKKNTCELYKEVTTLIRTSYNYLYICKLLHTKIEEKKIRMLRKIKSFNMKTFHVLSFICLMILILSSLSKITCQINKKFKSLSHEEIKLERFSRKQNGFEWMSI